MKKIFIKDEYMKTPVLRLRKDYVLNAINPNMYFYETLQYICDGVYYPKSYKVLDRTCSNATVCSEIEVDEEYAKLYDFKPRRFDISEIPDIVCEILKLYPRLHAATCLCCGQDPEKNPNYMNGNYIFPDGNTYGVILHRGKVYVFPGKADIHNIYNDSKRLPIVEFKINLKKWVDDMIEIEE